MSDKRQAYYEIEDFPLLKELSDNWKIIREDFLRLNAPKMPIARLGKQHDAILKEVHDYTVAGGKFGWLDGWGRTGANPDWVQYALIGFDSAVPYIDLKLNRTMDLLKKIKGIKVCAFAKLKAGTSLSVHTHPEIKDEELLQFHLPVVTAAERNYAYLNVDGQFRQFVCGEPIVFDGSLDHFALNESEEDRTIVYMEFDKKKLWQPRQR